MENIPGQIMFPQFEEQLAKETNLMCDNLKWELHYRSKWVPGMDPNEICNFKNPAEVPFNLTEPILKTIVSDKMQDDYREEHGQNAEEELRTGPVADYIWQQSEREPVKIITILKKNGLSDMHEFGFCTDYESLKGIEEWDASVLLALRKRLTREMDSIWERFKRLSPAGGKGDKPEKGDERNR